jgi:hypothetical protein
MSDNTPDAPTDAPTPGAETAPDTGGESTDWKSEARKWEQRAKENSSAAARLKEIEDASKSEAQRAQEALAEAQRERDEAAVRALRYEVAAERGIPADALELLHGTTREELEVKADKLKTLISDPQPDRRPDRTLGQTQTSGGTPGDHFAAFLQDQLT